MRRRKQRQPETPSPVFLFPQETIHLALEAVERFQQPLDQVRSQDERYMFAAHVITHVKAKLETMKTAAQAGHLRLVPFDSNERVILVAAIQMYRFDLSGLPVSPRQAWELEECKRIAAYFAPKRSHKTRRGKGRR